MVFMLIGAVKAAKHARNEYIKDKKRNTAIAPVDGSHDMMADRDSSSQSQITGTTDWWGTSRTTDASAPTCDATSNPNIVGAWSRDESIQQRNQNDEERPSSTYACSASDSTQLSVPIAQSPIEGSVSPSHHNAVRPSSPGSGDMEVHTRPSLVELTSELRPRCSEDQPMNRSSDELESGEEAERQSSLETRDSSRKTSEHAEDSLRNNGLRTADTSEPGIAIESVAPRARGARSQQDSAKASVEGSFVQAMQRKSSASTQVAVNSIPQQKGESVSALSRNASKGIRRKTGDMNNSVVDVNSSTGVDQVSESQDGTLSALTRNATKCHRKRLDRTAGNGLITRENERSSYSVAARKVVQQSALARNACKGPRLRHESLTNDSATLRSSGMDMIGSREDNGKDETCIRMPGQPTEAQAAVSAFAGAPTKRRVTRLPPTNSLIADTATVLPNASVSDLADTRPGAMRASTAGAGSSMYATGTMKKRTSRR